MEGNRTDSCLRTLLTYSLQVRPVGTILGAVIIPEFFLGVGSVATYSSGQNGEDTLEGSILCPGYRDTSAIAASYGPIQPPDILLEGIELL